MRALLYPGPIGPTCHRLICLRRVFFTLTLSISYLKALFCLAALLAEHEAAQKKLVMSGLGWLEGTPALRQILRVCLHNEHSPERSAARAVIRAFCFKNLEGQAMLAATFSGNKPGLWLLRNLISCLRSFSLRGQGAFKQSICMSKIMINNDNQSESRLYVPKTIYHSLRYHTNLSTASEAIDQY